MTLRYANISSSEPRTSVEAMPHSIAILGSTRSDGNTAKALHRLVHGLPCETVDLSHTKIAQFSYAQNYQDDDFTGIIERIVDAPVTILASPVYWYSYAAPMKIFIDRFSDLLFSKKPLGRRLRGCNFAFLSTGNAPQPDETLNQAFSNFCGYLGITNLGMVYACQDGPFYEDRSVLCIRKRIEAAQCRN
jgi:multimeric flavodoxin WrbA